MKNIFDRKQKYLNRTKNILHIAYVTSNCLQNIDTIHHSHDYLKMDNEEQLFCCIVGLIMLSAAFIWNIWCLFKLEQSVKSMAEIGIRIYFRSQNNIDLSDSGDREE